MTEGWGGDWEDGVMWQVLDPSRGLGMTGEKGSWFTPRRIFDQRAQGTMGGGGRDWEDGVMWQVLDPSRSLGMTGEKGREGMDSRLGARQRRTCSIFDRLGGRDDG